MNSPLAPDVTSPTVSITSPAAGTISGTTNVTANASDNVGVAGVQFLLDGSNLGAEDISAPYSVSWNTTTATNGTHTLTARARDDAGNTTTSTGVVVTVNNDTQAPAVALTEPSAGIVLGTINVSANASDNVAVVGVQFLLDGANLGSEDIVAPYTISWNTTTIVDGSHTLTARARDAAGNITTSTQVVVTVQNNPPDIQAPTVSMTAPAAGTISGTINVTANASDNVGVVGVQFLLNGSNLGTEDLASPYSISWNTTTVSNGTYTLTARARDAAGNTTTSTGVIVTVNNDILAPTVSITAPAAGTVTGTINVTANASDNIGVVGVQFLLDGANLGSEDVAAPYSVSWNTATATNGSHTLTARARDAAGNTTTSSGVIVTSSNITNLIVALPLNEGSGTAAGDISGSNHPGTLTNSPAWGAGKYGQGLTFNGTNNYVNIADHNDFTLDPAQSYTWSAWVKNNSFKEWSTVWSQTLNNSNFFYFYAHTSTDPDGGPVTNGISAYWWNSGGTNKIGAHSSNNVLTLGQWSHVAVTYDASQPQNNRFTIYVNGVDVTVRTDISSTGTITSINPTNVRVGSNQPFGEYLNGSVDEVRFYKRLLSQTEVAYDMNTPLAPDLVNPTVVTTAPPEGTVAGVVNVTAIADDNVGVAGVQFLIDGTNLGTEDIAPPFSASWNTTSVTNGTHVVAARARDAAGNTTTSDGVVVTVNNVPDTQAPTVTITAPPPGIVSGTVNEIANASDNVAVAGVQFLLDGVNMGPEDVSSPFSISWNTYTVPNGTYTLTAKARDAAGNIAISLPVVVTVNNSSNLVAAFPLNEGSGTATTDISGNGHNGTLTNSPAWGAGKYELGLTFNGTSNYVNVPDHADFTLDPTQSYTWSAWVKNTSFKEWSTVWSQTLNASNFFYFYAHTSTDPDGGPVTNGISVYWWTSGGTNKIGTHSSNNVLTAGQWSYVAVTYDASQPQNNRFTIYVNGTDVTDRTDVGSTGTITSIDPTNIRIGSNQPFGEYLNGSVDEVRFYKRLLSAAEVANDMNTSLAPVGARSVGSPIVKSSSGKEQVLETLLPGLAVKVNPNPSASYFTLSVTSSDKKPVVVRITDISGRVLENYNKINPNSALRIGETLATGAYLVEVIQGDKKSVMKIVKVE